MNPQIFQPVVYLIKLDESHVKLGTTAKMQIGHFDHLPSAADKEP